MNPRTTEPRQLEHCRNERSGSYSDKIAIWGILSPQSWHGLCDTQGARREATRFVLTEMRGPTCEACCHVACGSISVLMLILVELEVRDGTSAKALNVVCWCTGLQIVHALWNGYTAHAVMSEFKAVWGKHLRLSRDPCLLVIRIFDVTRGANRSNWLVTSLVPTPMNKSQFSTSNNCPGPTDVCVTSSGNRVANLFFRDVLRD